MQYSIELGKVVPTRQRQQTLRTTHNLIGAPSMPMEMRAGIAHVGFTIVVSRVLQRQNDRADLLYDFDKL